MISPRKNSERALKNSEAAYKSSEELYFLLLLEKKPTFAAAKHIIVATVRKNITKYIMQEESNKFMAEAIRLSIENVEMGRGGPFGAVVVKDGKIIARGANSVTRTNDPTAHAEVVAIRSACQELKSFQLEDCEIYTSCEPCPMCLGAIYWARPKAVYFGNSKEDAADIQFDDQFIYEEIARPIAERKLFSRQMMRTEAIEAFQKWAANQEKISY